MTASFDTLVRATVDRFAVLARPPRKEPSPVAAGAPPDEWARLAGIGCRPEWMPAPVAGASPVPPTLLDVGPNDPHGIAWVALQRMGLASLVEPAPGSLSMPPSYRPTRR